MLGPILITLIVAASDGQASMPTGQITATSGKIFLQRDGRRYQANARSALRPGDSLETTAGAGVGLFLYSGHAVLLGPETGVAIGGTTRKGVIRLDRGEVRATVDARGGLAIATPSTRARTGRGILHASATPAGTRLWAERGDVEVTPEARPTATIKEGQETFVSPAGDITEPIAATGQGWTVRPDVLRLAGAASDSRRLKDEQIDQASDATAIAFQASGQMGPAGTVPTTPEGAPPTPAGTTPTPAEEGALPTTAPTTPGEESASQPIAFAQPNTSFSVTSSSLALSGAAGAFTASGSGGLGSDAQQDSRNPAFPGNIHLITAQSIYNLSQVHLSPKDNQFPSSLTYYSIGVGPPPTRQVITSFLTGTGQTPMTIPIPHFNAYLIKLDQYQIPDPATSQPPSTVVSGISGLLGANPTAPQIQNATPLTDPRARFNNRATFALGEFALQRTGKHMNVPQIELRRSDQDRQIIPLTTTLDRVTPNPDVTFVRQPDFKFFPEFAQGVFVPVANSVLFPPTSGRLDPLRKAAVTTLLANTLLDYSHRTGQTQFAIGNLVIDTMGYHRPAGSAPTPVAASSSAASVARTAAAGVRIANRRGDSNIIPSLRSFGPRPEAARSGVTPGGHHAPGPHHR